MKKVIWSVAAQLGFLVAALSFNNAIAGDVKQQASQYPICDLGGLGDVHFGYADSLFFELKKMKGHVKSVSFGGYKPGLFQLDESGKVTSANIGGKKYEYVHDRQGRIASATESSATPPADLVFNAEFSYPDDNTVVIKTSWKVDGEDRWNFEVRSRSTNDVGAEVCIGTKWIGTLGLYDAIRVIRNKDGSSSSQALNLGDSLPQFLQRVGYADAFKLNNQAIGYLNTLPETPKECIEQPQFGAKYYCSFTENSKDGNDLKTVTAIQRLGDQKLFIKSIAWTNAEGLEFENVYMSDKPLSNGKRPHHFYKYKTDGHGNWIERQGY